jgi:hypothetical protein
LPDNRAPKVNSSLVDVILHDWSVRRTPADEKRQRAVAAFKAIYVITSDVSTRFAIRNCKARLMLYLAVGCKIRPISRKV